MMRMNMENLNSSSRSKLIRTAAIMQTVYATIEIVDCITAALMALGLIANLYPKMLFAEMQTLKGNKLPRLPKSLAESRTIPCS